MDTPSFGSLPQIEYLERFLEDQSDLYEMTPKSWDRVQRELCTAASMIPENMRKF